LADMTWNETWICCPYIPNKGNTGYKSRLSKLNESNILQWSTTTLPQNTRILKMSAACVIMNRTLESRQLGIILLHHMGS